MNFDFSCYKQEEEEDKSADKDGTILRIYALAKNNKSMLITVPDFCPYVYMSLPESVKWTSASIDGIKRRVVDISKEGKSGVAPMSVEFVMKKRLYYQ